MDKSILIDIISQANAENLQMYFVTRVLKEGVKVRARAVEKFAFKVYQIEINDELRKYIYAISIKQFDKIQKNEDLHFSDYDVITDDTDQLLVYKMDNESPFSDIVYHQLNQSPKKITDLNKILKDETLWAYCVEFEIDSYKSFYTFRKILPGKVGIEDKKTGIMRTFYDTNTKMLSILKNDMVSLDEQIDCILFKETFYVLKKFYFEQIVGMHEEYKKRAECFATSISQHQCFGDIKLLSEKIETKASIHKKLIKLEKLGNINSLTPQNIKKLKALSVKKRAPINVKDGKIQFETDADIQNVIKLLCDYFKTGDYSGKQYETYAGKLQAVE